MGRYCRRCCGLFRWPLAGRRRRRRKTALWCYCFGLSQGEQNPNSGLSHPCLTPVSPRLAGLSQGLHPPLSARAEGPNCRWHATANSNVKVGPLGRQRHLGSTRWAGPLLSGPSFWPVFRTKAASAGRATPASGFWYAPAAGKSGEVRWLPSAKLGGRQAAGVLFLGARLAWALAMRIKNALRSLGTLRRTRGYLREGNI